MAREEVDCCQRGFVLYCVANFCIQDWSDCAISGKRTVWHTIEKAYMGISDSNNLHTTAIVHPSAPYTRIRSMYDRRSYRRGAERLQPRGRTVQGDSSALFGLNEIPGKTDPLNEANKHIRCPPFTADQLNLYMHLWLSAQSAQ